MYNERFQPITLFKPAHAPEEAWSLSLHPDEKVLLPVDATQLQSVQSMNHHPTSEGIEAEVLVPHILNLTKPVGDPDRLKMLAVKRYKTEIDEVFKAGGKTHEMGILAHVWDFLTNHGDPSLRKLKQHLLRTIITHLPHAIVFESHPHFDTVLNRYDPRLGNLSLSRIKLIAQGQCQALSAVHAAGVVHADIKPEHFTTTDPHTLDPDQMKIYDFGGSHLVNINQVADVPRNVSTPTYLAPEVMYPLENGKRKGVSTPARDIYAMGACLYNLLFDCQLMTDHFQLKEKQILSWLSAYYHQEMTPVFVPESRALTLVADYLKKSIQVLTPSEHQAAVELQPAMEAFFQRALHRVPDQRPADAKQLYAEFAALVDMIDAVLTPLQSPAQSLVHAG